MGRGFTGNTKWKWHVGGGLDLNEHNSSTIGYYGVGKRIHTETALEAVQSSYRREEKDTVCSSDGQLCGVYAENTEFCSSLSTTVCIKQ